MDRAVSTMASGGCDPVWVVLGAWVGEVPGARCVVNEAWESGMGSSLAAGITAISTVSATEGIDAIAITLVDLPGLTAAAVRRVCEDGRLAVATYHGKRGHPVLVSHEYWDELLGTLGGDQGARDFLRARGDVVSIEVGDVADGADLDVPEVP